jgi:phosphoribosyl 1,2-cyclic phosphodiesterase
MGMQLQILASGSSGNCALLETPSTRILIDAGLSGRMTIGLLEQAGVPIESIEAVFLTHEHGDHASGLRGLAKFRHLKFFANYATASVARDVAKRPLDWQLFESGTRFHFADLTVEAHLVPHDALEPVGFIFRNGGDDLFNPPASLGWFTDLGHIPPALLGRIAQVDTLVLESNHCETMLEADSKRPWSVKQRIRGRHGHLSNQMVVDFLQHNRNAAWRNVLLGHLSKDCNCSHTLAGTTAQLQLAAAIHCLDPRQQLFPPMAIGWVAPGNQAAASG